VSRAPSNLISLDDIDAALNDPTTQEPVARQDLPIYQGRGGIRKDAKDAMRPDATSLLEEAYGAATSFSPLPKWYTDFGGSVLKSVEGFAGSVGQGLGDLASTLSGGLIDLTGSSVDKSRAYDLLRSDDPELRVQGQRLIDQARTVEDATREGFRLEMQRNRETPLPGVDPDSWASTAGNIVGSVAPSIAALVPGMQAPVLAGYFSNSYESAYDQYADTKIAQTGGYDTTTAATVGVISGAIEAAMEFLPIRGIKKASAAARQALVESAMSGSANWRAQAAKQVAKLVGLGAAQEGAEEGTTELAGEILRLTYDEQLREKYKNDPTTAALEAAERITKAALAGAVGGGLLGGAGFGTALAGSGGFQGGEASTEAPQDAMAPDAAQEAVAQPEQVATEGVPITQQDEAIKRQAKALRGEPVQKFTIENVRDAFKIDDEQAAATVALANAMGLDTGRIGVQSGGGTETDLAQENADVWYSKLNEVVTQKMGGAMDADQLRAMLANNGVKPEEMEWSGVGGLSGKVTKQQIIEHLAENAVKVTETELGGSGRGTKFSEYQEPGGASYRELLLTLPSREKGPGTEDNFATYAAGKGYSEDDIDRAWRNDSDPVYSDWVGRRFHYDRGVPDFRSSHFDEPNILAHVRFNERTDADGKRVLFIEEVQSDWHQQGRDKGYASNGKDVSKVPDAPFKKSWHELAMKRMIRYAAENGFDRIAWTKGDTQNKRYSLGELLDYISWETKGDGYKYIVAKPRGHTDDGWRELVFLSDDGVVAESMAAAAGTPLSEIFGKDVASRIESDESGDISEDGLAVGGHGMTGFYDKILVTDTNKIIKRHGAKVVATMFSTPGEFSEEENQTEPGETFTAHGFDITDSMRSEALQKGMPLFQSRKGSVSFTDDGKAIIRGLSSPDVSTGVHELFHVARKFLLDRSVPSESRLGITDEDIAEAESFSGAKDGKWTRDAEEKFARAGERYLRDGKSPTKRLDSLFKKFSQWLSAIYKSIAGSPVDVKITPAMRAVFDRLVSRGGPSAMMETAFGVGMVERPRVGDVPASRVSRPEAIKALRAAGKIPTTQDPFDFMHEVASEPERYAEFIDALRANPDMSRGQADALFGEENAKALFENAEGDKAQRISAKERRKIWVESTLELADSNALGIGPSPQSNVPLPPESAGKGRPAQPADNRIVFADDVWTRFQESQLDELEKLVKLQNAVLAETGAKELPDRDNPEMALRLAKSKRRYEQERFHNGPNGAIPTLREMAEKRITPWRVGRLAAALHAEEANQQVAKLNPDDPTVGYGLSNDESRKIIAQEVAAPDSALVFKFAAWLSERMEERTSLDQVAGVVSARDVAQMRAVYSSFVTTQDDPDFVDHDADVAGMSSMPRNAYSVAASQRLNRLGRSYGSLDDPNNPRARALFDGMFAHTIEAYERGILRRSQNHVLNTLRRFADTTQAVQAGLTVRFEPPIVRKMNRATGEVETDKEALSAYKARPDVLYGKLDEEVTLGNGAKLLPGTPFFIEVADANLADTLKTVKTDGALQAAVLGALRAGAGLTRFFATSILNPAYAPAGLARDWQTGMAAILTEPEFADLDDKAKVIRDFTKGIPQAAAAVLRSVVGKPGNGEFDRYYEEMKAAGGTQEMFAMSDFDKSKAVVKSIIEPNILTRSKDAFDTFVDMTSRLTKPTEDGTRLSIYAILRKRGWSRDKAALAARKFTLDFQIHGKDTTVLRAGWAFLNASVQGQRKIVRMLRTPVGKRIAGAYFLAGFVYAVTSYLVLDDDENKDGKPDSAQIPPWERDTYIRIPGLGVQIPTMWGMQPALSAGWWMGEAFAATMGKADVDHAANAAAFGNAILDGFNPAGGSDAFSVNGLANLVSPSLTDMAVQSAMNKDWRGNQLANAPIGRKQALTWVDSQHPFETTPEMFVNAAQFMNRWTGGDESTSGFVDVAPETIRHVVSSLFGGGYRTLEKIGGVVGAPYTGDLKTWMDLPIVDTFTTKTPDPKAVNAEYAKYEDISTRYLARIKAYEDSNNFEALRTFLSESDDLAMMSMIVEPTRKNIESMREMLRETDDAGIRRSLLESIQREREAAMGLIRSGLRRR